MCVILCDNRLECFKVKSICVYTLVDAHVLVYQTHTHTDHRRYTTAEVYSKLPIGLFQEAQIERGTVSNAL